MLLSPSLSPSPLDSPSTTTTTTTTMSPPPLPPPSPPLLTPHLAPTSTPPIQQPPLLPVISPPPPAAVAISPVATPPLPSVVTSPQPTPPVTTTIGPIASPPPPALVIIPPPQPPTALPLPPPSLILPPPLTTPPSLPPPPLTTAPSLPLPRLPINPPPTPTPPPSLVIIPPPLPPASLPLPPPSLILPPPLTKAPSLAPPPLTKAPSLPPPRLPIDPPPFTSISPPQPPASPESPAASHSIKSPKTPGPFQAIPSPAQPPPPVSFQSFPPPAPPPPPLTLTGRKGGLTTTKQTTHSPLGLIVASIGVTILIFVVLSLVCICCKRRRRKHKPLDTKKQQCSVQKDDFFAVSIQHKQGNVVNAALGSGSVLIADNTTLNSSIDGIFTYEELVIATDGFSESNLLGQGGFGYVYKGRLSTGQDVAVKKLKAESRQGEREFRAEVETISRVHHKHLVSLVGYCINEAERLLVYEFVTNKTLEFHLYENGQPVMVWESRLKIAIGSAKGLAYLHEDCSPTIIHRDIKAANILLDMRFEAKVSDFGLAKIFFDASSSITHISTRVMGTFGYLAPEYALTGKLTDKSDVYSYGVMLLELITGRPPIIEQDSSTNQSLVDWARPLLARALEDNDFDTLVDRRLNGSYNKSKMASMVSCAAACIRQSAWLRPRMIQVVRALEDDISLPYLVEGTRFSNSSSNASSDTFIRNAKRCINNDGCREHNETTSEYGI